MTQQPDQPPDSNRLTESQVRAMYGALGVVVLSVIALIAVVATVGGIAGFTIAMGLLCVVVAVPALVIFRAPRNRRR